jgi:hypothetical protein
MVDKMDEACDKDVTAYNAKQPAIHKLLLSKQFYSQIKNLDFQTLFMENGGLDTLANWMKAIDDEVYPNITLVTGLLDCLSGLPISNENLIGSPIYNIVSHYACGGPGIHADARRLA